MNNKVITTGHEARMKIKAGIDKAVLAVAPTLGAVGMSAIISVPGLTPLQSDDGITILKNLQFSDPYEQIGLELLREAALRTSREGGDGTATTTVLTGGFVGRVLDELQSDESSTQAIKERLDKGLGEAIRLLDGINRPVGDNVQQIAEISSLDTEMAQLIAEAIAKVGAKGVITVEKSPKLGYSSEVVKGAKFDKGLISPFFITDPERQEAVLEYPHIVLVDRKLSTNEQILSLLNSIGTGTEILFIADDVESVALGTLAHNAVNQIAKIACVRNPYTGAAAKEFLFDLAALTGATVISEERGMKMDTLDKSVCGKADKVIVTRDSTTIIVGDVPIQFAADGAQVTLKQRIEGIERQIEDTNSSYEKKGLEERLASLTGGIGVIRVGTYTDTEFAAKKLKFDNAIAATQAALQEGIVPGGGIALMTVASQHTDKELFGSVLTVPFVQQLKNAGMDNKDTPVLEFGKGINFRTRTANIDMFDEGIVDPRKVVRLALESAVSIASILVTAETVIVNEETSDER